MNLIEQAKLELPNYDKIVDKLNKRQAEFGEGFDKYFQTQLRRELKKLKMNPLIEKQFFIIGCDAKNWGAIMRKKYNSTIYPEEHHLAGQIIPENDITYSYYVFSADQIIREFISKKDYSELIGKLVKIKYQENKREIIDCVFFKEVAQNEITFKGIPKVKISQLLKGVMPEGVFRGYLDRPLIQLSNVNVLDLRISNDLGIIKVDDDSSENNDSFITLFINKNQIRFTEDAMGLEVFGFASKNEEKQQVNMNVIGVFIPDERFRLTEKPKPLVEDEEESPLFSGE